MGVLSPRTISSLRQSRKEATAQEFYGALWSVPQKGAALRRVLFGSGIPAHRGRSRGAISNENAIPRTISSLRQSRKKATAQEFYGALWSVSQKGAALRRVFSEVVCRRIGAGRGTQFRMGVLSPHDFRFEPRRKRGAAQGFYGALWSVSQKRGCASPFFHGAARARRSGFARRIGMSAKSSADPESVP